MASKRLSLSHSQIHNTHTRYHTCTKRREKNANTTIWPLFGKFCTSTKWNVEKYDRAPSKHPPKIVSDCLVTILESKKNFHSHNCIELHVGTCYVCTRHIERTVYIRSIECESAGFYETRIHILWAHVQSIFFENFLLSNRTNLVCNDVHRAKMFRFFPLRVCVLNVP